MNLLELYKAIEELKIFSNFSECESCPVLCSRDQNVHWLLPEEAKRLKGQLNITRIKGACFFKGGLCPLLENKKCSIYRERPLECRLNPIAIHELDGQLYWIIYTVCPIVKKRSSEKVIEMFLPAVKKLSPLIDEELKEEFRKISRAIKSFDPLVEGRDFIRLIKLE